MPAARPQVWPLDKIIPYPSNPRTHPAEQVTLLAKLIQRHGIDQPIVVDEDGFILKGHGRRMAAVEAGLKTFPVVIHVGLSEDDKRAIRLADNQVALLSGWNQDLLRVELTELSNAGYDMPLLGFDKVQLVSFMASVPSGGDPDAVPEPPKKAVSRLGDVWLMGKHRMLCGDSTKKEDVELVLNGEEPNLMVTDPPYGVEYDANWRNETGIAEDGSLQRLKTGRVRKAIGAKALGKVENDDRADWSEAWRFFPGDVAYCWHAGRRASDVDLSFRVVGFEVRCQIIWNKGRMIIGRGDYHWAHEPCWYLVRKGAPGGWSGDRKQTTMWDIEHRSSETGHSTQKPVECMRRPIINNSRPGSFVYEPFSGSGTTIIAAEMTTRYCLAIELSAVYVDVGVERWQTLTKQEATLEGDGRTFAEIAKARSKKAPARTGASRKGRRDQAAGAPQ